MKIDYSELLFKIKKLEYKSKKLERDMRTCVQELNINPDDDDARKRYHSLLNEHSFIDPQISELLEEG